MGQSRAILVSREDHLIKKPRLEYQENSGLISGYHNFQNSCQQGTGAVTIGHSSGMRVDGWCKFVISQ